VDTNAVNGADNSYFSPGSNQLAFGHGCVDDNEDADVILHEYGHAINHDINENFNGGDTGAMGEGFGDYWGGAYSLSTPNGSIFSMNKIFTWDSEPCWPGRILNATDLKYDHQKSYRAHEPLQGGLSSDEMWSTPLYQALLTLRELGVDQKEVDTIVLESQFGLGAGIKMRDMANSIVLTARRLYPDGPHADVFKDKFLQQQIIDQPTAILTRSDLIVSSEGGNDAIDPGENANLLVSIKNSGTLEAKNVRATLTAKTPGVSVVNSVSRYPDIAIGQSAANIDAFELQVDENLACGTKIKLELKALFDGSVSPVSFSFELPTGLPQGASESAEPQLSIPDNSQSGVTSSIIVPESDYKVSENFNVDVKINHSYIGDLVVKLISPSGKEVALHERSGGSAQNIVGNYPLTLTPADSLESLVGEPISGEWRLLVVDGASQDTGKFLSWSINDIVGFECEAR
jgi:subtilisin-like proprotein convertase family protein